MEHVLEVAIRNLEGEELLPAGAPFDAGVLAQVAAAGKGKRWDTGSLLEFGSVRADLARFSRQGHYASIFGAADTFRSVEETMSKVRLPLPCLAGLEYFRHYDGYTYRHFLMVFALTCLISRTMRPGQAQRASEMMAGPLHDFGKLCVPLPVLTKRTPLLRAERRQLEQHTIAGHILLTYYLQEPENLTCLVARDHHERRDGSGYPRGVAQGDLVVEIVAACDVYDALVSPRPYRARSYDNRSALEELTDLAERGRLGWEVIQHLVALNRRDRPAPERCEVSRERRGAPPEGNLYGLIADEPAPGPR